MAYENRFDMNGKNETHITLFLASNHIFREHRKRELETNVSTHFTAMYDKDTLYIFNLRGELVEIHKNDMSFTEFAIKLIFYKALEFLGIRKVK